MLSAMALSMKGYLYLVLLFIVAGFLTAEAQNFSDEITLVTWDDNTVTVESSAAAEKKKDAQDLAIKSAFNALFHSGVEGLKNGSPIVAKKRNDYDYRFFNESRYVNYIVGVPTYQDAKKIGSMQKVRAVLTINLRTLVKDVESNNLALNPGWSDSKKTSATASLNPTIVIVPYMTSSEGYSFESMRTKLEDNPYYRNVIDIVAEHFQKNGFKTRDFMTQLQNSKNSALLRQDTQTDDATMLVQQLPGDIVVTVDAQLGQSASNTQITLNLSAVERQTAGRLAAKSFSSGYYMTQDAGLLAGHAVKKMQSDFFSQLNSSFEAMIKAGREVNIELNLGESVDSWDFDQDAPASGEFFKDSLEEWLRAKSFGSVYDMSVSTDKYIAVTINVPLWDQEKNRSYTLSNFSSEFRKFLKSHLGEEYNSSVTAMGQKIMVKVE